MKRRLPIGARPLADPKAETWIRQGDAQLSSAKSSIYTARLTIDVTPQMRAKIKVTAFQQGLTVAEVVRDLLKNAFPENPV